MVTNTKQKRRPGRPRIFDPNTALDHAIELFWREGFEAADVDCIARATGVAKPSLYRLFGDKSALFLHALQRYAATHGAKAVSAFVSEPDIRKAVTAFLELTVHASTVKGGPKGCLMACIAIGQTERSAEVQAFCARGLADLTGVLARRFEAETEAGRLSNRASAQARARLLVDTVQGIVLRARAGVPRKILLEDVRSYLSLISE